LGSLSSEFGGYRTKLKGKKKKTNETAESKYVSDEFSVLVKADYETFVGLNPKYAIGVVRNTIFVDLSTARSIRYVTQFYGENRFDIVCHRLLGMTWLLKHPVIGFTEPAMEAINQFGSPFTPDILRAFVGAQELFIDQDGLEHVLSGEMALGSAVGHLRKGVLYVPLWPMSNCVEDGRIGAWSCVEWEKL
jgi:hypothetical protein